MADTYKTGEIVQLKSGGPKMTVAGTVGGRIACQWFAGSKLEQGVFQIDTLVKAPPDEKKKK
jgi:uncharacterized protein YodC (DUF2158 family)